jgi:signal transduction histidine kinase
MKDEFLSMASHELKTPITSIKIFCDLVARGYDVARPELVAILGRQSDHLVRLVNDLLDVSRLQLGRMPLETSPLNLVELVSRLCAQRRYVCQKHVVTCAQDGDKITVKGDAARLEQVFSNLLENAHKYSPQASEIAVRICRRAGKAIVEVQDEGVGISPEHLPRIFELFFKPASQQGKAEFPGLGVGLYVCRSIVERHGGRIWAESEVGKGSSTFFVELPLAPNEAD